jgi:hypothetical protein
MCIVSDQTSEAGNLKYCSELHAGSGLRLIIRFQENVWIVAARGLGWATDPRKYGHPSVRVALAESITLDHGHLWRKCLVMHNWKRIAVLHRRLKKHHELESFGRLWYREVRDFIIRRHTAQGGLVRSKSNFDYKANSMVSNSKELSFAVCHEKAKWIIGYALRCLVGRLERAMTINVIFQVL